MNENTKFLNEAYELDDYDRKIKELKIKEYNFVDTQMKSNINKVCKNIFKKLNKDDLGILILFIVDIIEFIAIKFGFINDTSNFNHYQYQFYQNNFQDIKAIINLLLPYIDDKNKYENHSKIINLDDILMPKKEFTLDNKILVEKSNLFDFSNIQLDLSHLDKYNNAILWKKMDLYLLNNYYGILHTVEVIASKLYVNWINVRPITIDHYKQSNIFINTKKLIEKWKKNLSFDDYITDTKSSECLYLGDIYNTCVHDFYLSVKNVKWLIYTTSIDKKIYCNIYLLDRIIGLSNIVENKTWDELSDTKQLEYNNNWYKIFENLKNDIGIKEYKFEVIENLIKYLIVFFRTNYSKNYLLQKSYKSLSGIKKLEDDDDDENDRDLNIIKDLSIKELMYFVKDIEFSYFYDFIYESIQYFRNTMYGKKLIKENIITNDIELLNDKDYKYPLILKNLYNLGKSIYHNNLDKNGDISNYWDNKFEYYQSMNNIQRFHFIAKITGYSNIKNWYKLNSNFKIIYPEASDYNKYINEISQQINDNLINLIFESLIYKGILSQFVPDKDLTDEQILPSNYQEKNSYIKKKLKSQVFNSGIDYSQSYYFPVKKMYKDLAKIKVSKSNKRYEEISYIDFICNNEPYWFTFYAMDWLSQIQFFHHFIHNRVMYVTGSTGQGKSTQVPKLLLYGLEMIDYKNNGKVICTQPRIPPTIGNSEEIANQMGLPLKKFNEFYEKDISIDNFTLQFKYQGNSHENKNYNQSFLKIVTDGTLLEEMVQNIAMKERSMASRKDYVYGMKNIYDILIVDEAHEHNINMDLILTIARNSLYFNNSLRLIIISATIDDDEPIYRRYYKEINDNLMYPINLGSWYDDDDENYRLVERKFIDRRYHISPPGKTTQYVIDDIYLKPNQDNYIPNPKNDHLISVKNSQIAQELTIQKAIEICKQGSISGNILLFSTGENEIRQIVKTLNEQLNGGNVALPFFSSMNQEYKNIIKSIDKKIGDIRNIQQNIHLEWGPEFISDKKNPEGMYKRAIIVATNVAEASITIPKLKYVIDNGFAKTGIYNMTLGSELVVKEISESSRIQRRGRVGRIADGIVYYMYQKDGRKKNLPIYNITDADISQNLYKLLRDNTVFKDDVYQIDQEEELFLPEELDPNMTNLFNDNYKALIDIKFRKEGKYNEHYIFKTNYDKIIRKQYMLNNLPISYLYHQVFYNYKSGKNKRWNHYDMYLSGFSHNVILDKESDFYLIHPNENNLIRSFLTGTAINKLSDYERTVLINHFIYKLTDKLLVVNIKDDLKKTVLGTKYLDLSGALELYDLDIGYTISMSLQLECFDEVLIIYSMLQSCSQGIKSLIKEEKVGDKTYYKIDEFFQLYGDENSDLGTLLNVYNNLFNRFKKDMKIFNIHQSSNKYLLDMIKEKFNKNKQKYSKIKKLGDTLQYNNINMKYEDFLEFKKLDDKNQLYDDKAFLKLLNSNEKILDILYKNLMNAQPEIKEWCNNNYINYDTIQIFFQNYQKLIRNIISIDRNNEDYDDKNLKWFQDNMKKYQIYKEDKKINNIIKCFMYSNYSNLFVSDNLSKSYKSLTSNQNYEIDNLFSIKTLTSVSYPSTIIYGYSKHHMTKNIQFISRIELKWLTELFPHIYNNINLNNNVFKSFEDYKLYNNLRRNSEFNKKLKYNIRNTFKIDYLRNMSVVDKTPIIDEFVKENIKKLK